MNIALTTIGSRGDIQPYIALGIELLKNGHSVAVATHPWAKEIVHLYGLNHLSVGDDLDINYSARQFVAHSSGYLKGFKFALNFIFDNLRSCHADFLSALKDFDLIIGHGIVGEAEAEILNKPFVAVSIAPMGLPKHYWKSKNIIAELSVYLSDKIIGMVFGKPYRRFRRELGLPSSRSKNQYPYLAMVPMPSFLQKPDPNWRDSTEITGFFFADTPNDYLPPEDLWNYITRGAKPILLTFGSMFHNQDQTKHLYTTACEALDQSNTRAVIIMPDLNEAEITTPGNVFIAKQIPYSWLLCHVELVIHHFGFGTTAEVLRAGLPSIPVPHIFDQKIRASAIHKLGYASKPLDMNHLNSAILSSAIDLVKNDRNMKMRCREAGTMISNEKGTLNAVKLINRHIELISSTSRPAFYQ